MKKILAAFLICVSGVAFSAFVHVLEKDKPIPIPRSKQRLGGNAEKGYTYLISGDYVKSGLPYSLFSLSLSSPKNYLNRTGPNAKLPYSYNALKTPDGQLVATPNCLQCHAQVFNNQLIIGLGNSYADFTKGDEKAQKVKQIEWVLKHFSPKTYKATASFLTPTQTIGPYLMAEVKGVNLASRLTTALVAHRDPLTFKWSNEPQLEIPEEVIPTDTPPWWILKKKNAMFYNGFGRGDFGRFLMASNLLTVNDTSESRQVDDHMPDLLAYIYSLQPPK